MALEVVELEVITPPAGAVFGVPIGTIEQAVTLFQWAASQIDYTCTLTTPVGQPEIPAVPPSEDTPGIPAVPAHPGMVTIRIEGRNASPVEAEVVGERWIVFNNGVFEVYETAAEALAIYRIKQQ